MAHEEARFRPEDEVAPLTVATALRLEPWQVRLIRTELQRARRGIAVLGIRLYDRMHAPEAVRLPYLRGYTIASDAEVELAWALTVLGVPTR